MSSWSTMEWDAFCALLEEGWPGEFDDDARASWRVLLDPLEPAKAVEALRRLLYAGGTFRPSVAELLAEARRDPALPTFDEALVLIRRAIAKAPPAPVVYADDHRQERAGERSRDTVVLDMLRSAGVHPAIVSFAERQTIRRLRTIPLDDPDYGEIRRKELREAWDRHMDASDFRQRAALASGRPDGLRQLDPLSAAVGEIPATSQSTQEKETTSAR